MAISSPRGGQSVSQVLQWKTSVPDFRSCSNSGCVNFDSLIVVVWTGNLECKTIPHKRLLGVLHFISPSFDEPLSNRRACNRRMVSEAEGRQRPAPVAYAQRGGYRIRCQGSLVYVTKN